jgi:hypothetical protein
MLTGGEPLARSSLAPCDSLLEIDLGVDCCHSGQPLDLCGDALLCSPEMRHKNQGLTVYLLLQQTAACEHLRQSLLDRCFRHLQ